ncbi:MAG: cbb3-type cytochrome c oxidase subunit I, partial [Desulfobacterales bacterium]
MSEEATENVSSGNQTAKAFTLTSAFWFAAATSFGMIGAGYLIAPDFMANIEYILFGRMRPMHINAVLFGFVTPGLLAAAFYYFPKLLRTELFSHRLGVISAIFWNITVAAGIISVSMGYTQGREYAELPWFVDIMVVISFVMVVVNILMTVRRRKEKILFVSIWYTTAAVVLTSITYCLGNVIWKPNTGALLGIPDAILLWFYGHNIFGLLL